MRNSGVDQGSLSCSAEYGVALYAIRWGVPVQRTNPIVKGGRLYQTESDGDPIDVEAPACYPRLSKNYPLFYPLWGIAFARVFD
jgi:hypothetical protein